MNMSNATFFGAMVLFNLIVFPLFDRSRDLAFKKKYFPGLAVLMGLSFLAPAFFTEIPWILLCAWGPVVAFVTYANITDARFCETCAKIIPRRVWSSKKARYCTRCGTQVPDGARAKLEASAK